MSTIVFVAVLALLAVGILLMGGRGMQRLVIANLFGLGFTGVSWVALIVFAEASNDWGWRQPYAFPWLLGAALLTLLDLAYRRLFVRSNQGGQESEADGARRTLRSHWLAPTHGASLIVLPVWVLGALLVGIFAVLCFLDFLWIGQDFPMAY